MEEYDSDEVDPTVPFRQKKWLNTAEHSMAKLSKVRHKVYTVGLTDPRSLKPPRGISARAMDMSSGEQAANRKPCWESSIPDLIKQQSARSQQPPPSPGGGGPRPESARVRLRRPTSAKKARPHSAHAPIDTTQCSNITVKKTRTNHYSLVQGAHYESEERPPGMAVYQGSGGIAGVGGSGWVPPSGMGDPNQLTNDEVADIIGTVRQQQRDRNGMFAPRCSPDFEEMLNNSQEKSQMGEMVDELLNDVSSPRAPTPIHLNLPTMEMDEDVDDIYLSDEEYTSPKSKPQQQRTFATSYLPPPTNDTSSPAQTSKRPPRPPTKGPKKVEVNITILPNQMDDVDDDDDDINDVYDDDEAVSEEDVNVKDILKKQRTRSVTIAEHMNKTKDITPRHARVKSAGPMRPAPVVGAYSILNRPSSASYTNTNRGGSGSQPKKEVVQFPTVSLAYEMLKEEYAKDECRKKDPQKKKKKAYEDPETMMSRLDLNGFPGSESGSNINHHVDGTTKQVSSGEKDYTRVGIGGVNSSSKSSIQSSHAVLKTTKTLELADGGGNLMEKKSTSVLSDQPVSSVVERKDLVKPPRPVSAKKVIDNNKNGQQSEGTEMSQISETRSHSESRSLGASRPPSGFKSTPGENVNRSPAGINKSPGIDKSGAEKSPAVLNRSPYAQSQIQRQLSAQRSQSASRPTSASRPGSGKTMRRASLTNTEENEIERVDELRHVGERTFRSEDRNIKRREEKRSPNTDKQLFRSTIDRAGDVVTAVQVTSERDQRNYGKLSVSPEKKDGSRGFESSTAKMQQRRIASAPPRRTEVVGPYLRQLASNSETTFNDMEKKKFEKKYDHTRTHEKSSAGSYLGQDTSTAKGYADGNVVEIWTRREDFTYETDGLKECKGIQERLATNGVPVSLETLKRALLPPTEYGWTGPSYKSTMHPSLPANYSNGLLSKPETWLPDEAKRLQIAKKLVRQANESLAAQEREKMRERAAAGQYHYQQSESTSQKKKKVRKAGSSTRPKSAKC